MANKYDIFDEVEVFQDYGKNRRSHYFYGGAVMNFYYKNMTFTLVANGDMVGTIYKDGEEIARFKDRYNNGLLYGILLEYIPEINTDEKLEELITFDFVTEETLKSKATCIYFDSSNQWELTALDENTGELYDCCLDFPKVYVDDAIDFAIENIPKLYEEISKWSE